MSREIAPTCMCGYHQDRGERWQQKYKRAYIRDDEKKFVAVGWICPNCYSFKKDDRELGSPHPKGWGFQ